MLQCLKLSTKAKVSYQVSESLENAIHLATIYNTAIYIVDRIRSLVSEEIKSNSFKAVSLENNKIIPMELNRTKYKQKSHIAKICLNKQTSNSRTFSSTNANMKQVNLIEKEVSVYSKKKEKLL
ncbi:20821_t:CDS:2 [Cetraspora pellucida]|uniref:20821_t:CDS:1 n=1 Tax=Cetraspora pellucida TaxID=1433469 RepID=A0A9N9GB63_9GLOM|nr:20821_t:CDS:2 [Cetraspora pellucida]